MKHRTIAIAVAVVLLTAGFSSYAFAESQEGQARLIHSTGTGTLRVGREKFQVTSVVLKLLDDHKLELTMVSDITVFLSGTWTSSSDGQREIEISISSKESNSSIDATGKLNLGSNSNSIERLTLNGMSRTTKRSVELTFQGK